MRTGWQLSASLSAPDRRFILSSLRLLNRRITSRIALVFAASAFAVTAITAGGLAATAAARPASPVHSVRSVYSASPVHTASPVHLADAVLAPPAGTISATAVTEVASARQLAQIPSKAAHRKPHRKHHRHHRLSPKRIAWLMMHRFGWRAKYQFKYVKWIWDRESSWNVYATNPYSGAYGIPQALPAYKMASAGRNWRTSAKTQIRWGLRYIRDRYGSPRRAWDHEIDFGWY